MKKERGIKTVLAVEMFLNLPVLPCVIELHDCGNAVEDMYSPFLSQSMAESLAHPVGGGMQGPSLL